MDPNQPQNPSSPLVEPANPVKPNSAPKSLIILLVVLVISLLGSTSYLAFQNYQLKKIIGSPSTSPFPTSSPVAYSTTDWKTYINEKYGFKVEYPPVFLPNIMRCGEQNFGKWNVVIGFDEEPEPLECSFYIFASTSFNSIEQIIEDDADNYGGGAQKTVNITKNDNITIYTTKTYDGNIYVTQYEIYKIKEDNGLNLYNIKRTNDHSAENLPSVVTNLFYVIKENASFRIEINDADNPRLEHPDTFKILSTFKFIQ